MPSNPIVLSRRRRPGLLLALGLLLPLSLIGQDKSSPNAAPEASGNSVSEHAAMSSTEIASALSQLDSDLSRLDQLAGAIPTADQKADAKARQDALRKRADELKSNFSKEGYDALKADVQSEIDRVSSLAKDKPTAFLPPSDASHAYAADLPAGSADPEVIAAKLGDLADPMHKSQL